MWSTPPSSLLSERRLLNKKGNLKGELHLLGDETMHQNKLFLQLSSEKTALELKLLYSLVIVPRGNGRSLVIVKEGNGRTLVIVLGGKEEVWS